MSTPSHATSIAHNPRLGLTNRRVGPRLPTMDDATRANRLVWQAASTKYIDEYDDTLAIAASGASLLDLERALLQGILEHAPCVVHLQSGNGTDDVALAHAGAGAGAGSVIGDRRRLQQGRDRLRPASRHRPGRPLQLRPRRTPRRTARQGLRRPGLHRQGSPHLDARPAALGPRRRPAPSSRPATCSSSRNTQPSRSGPRTPTNPASVPTAATSPGLTSTTHSPAAGPPYGNGPSANSSPQSPTPDFRSFTSASTQSPSGRWAGSPPQLGQASSRTHSPYSPAEPQPLPSAPSDTSTTPRRRTSHRTPGRGARERPVPRPLIGSSSATSIAVLADARQVEIMRRFAVDRQLWWSSWWMHRYRFNVLVCDLRPSWTCPTMLRRRPRGSVFNSLRSSARPVLGRRAAARRRRSDARVVRAVDGATGSSWFSVA